MFSKKTILVAMILAATGPVGGAWAVDSDGDGVEDHLDACCNTPAGSSVDGHGRPIGDLDLDCDVDLFDFAMFLDNFGGPLPPCPSCTTSDECAGDHYCARPTGACATPGHCEPRPTSCMPVWEPVCGCDGVTYDNACSAAEAGKSLEYEGPCVPPFCETNTDCQGVGYCAKTEGNCGGLGDCLPAPIVCVPLWDPVCGCDGNTYDNSCYAARVGENVHYPGECAESPCQSSADCALQAYCAKIDGDCDGDGQCEPRPAACIPSGQTVCGCDGNTYGDHCYAALEGVSVDFDGPCPG